MFEGFETDAQKHYEAADLPFSRKREAPISPFSRKREKVARSAG
ncbi:hypothetical protein [Xanthomonas citri]|nr:hypothetical protein [Xanthomonas citri]MDS0760092.1 hypothetical protein [Xanthomonas citri pv. punicae]MDS0763869.1 hypothetical protein [Xanthomonas citri pv. punicae]MDS0798640.1 hypothetical protein [Xanthomonas citri pv. punicae]MDS0831266.1 hypothetical protein [Xanthomonas citri pv. punicae]MDS0835085.1 hypothetical protein [Xanthomonas citri pv. punicae]